MQILSFLLTAILSTTSILITEPVNGETYNGDWLTIRAIVENESEIPDSVHCSINGAPDISVPRLNTDWYTYMADNCRRGFSESPSIDTNNVLWTAPVTGDMHEFGAPVVSNGIVYHASDDVDTLYAVSASTGELIWKQDLINMVDDGVMVYNGRVYSAADSTSCFDAATGEKLWARGWTNRSSGTPAVWNDILFTVSVLYNDCIIHALDAYTGEDIWEVASTFNMQATPTAVDGVVYVPLVEESDDTGPLLALNANTGEVLWQSDLNCGFWDTSPCVVDSVIFIGGEDEKLHCLDRYTGEVIWETNLCLNVESSPAYFDGLVYAGAARTDDPDSINVSAIDATSGEFVWSVNSALHGSVGVAGGMVYWGEWGSANSSVFAADAYTGEIIWEYPIPTSNLGLQSSPAITDGVMYIASTDWNLYAFGTGLKYTYLDDLYAQTGANELIVTSFDDGVAVAADTISFTVTGTGINLEPSYAFNLNASPNPFRSNADISFELAEPCFVTIEIFDLTGRSVTSLVNNEIAQGEHTFQWDGYSNDGKELSPGVYLCRIKTGSVSETIGMCLLR